MFKFPGQRPNEKVLMVIRKHAIVYIRIILALILTVIMPLVIFLMIWFHYYPAEANSEFTRIVGVFSCIYLLYGLLLACIAWINEAFDLFILTDERLIDITQISFFRRDVASTPLKQIQDTTSHVDGFLPTVLNYGNIDVQTAAGNASDFNIDRVPDPAALARAILNYARDSRDERIEEIHQSHQKTEIDMA